MTRRTLISDDICGPPPSPCILGAHLGTAWSFRLLGLVAPDRVLCGAGGPNLLLHSLPLPPPCFSPSFG